ncbi:MAG: alpha/beta fold hydrolase, partial [Pseudomonadota bacterium]
LAARYPHRVSRLTIVGGFADGTQTGGSSIINSLLRSDGYASYALQSIFQMWTSSRLTFEAGLGTVIGRSPGVWKNKNFRQMNEHVRQDLLKSDPVQLIRVGQWLKKQKITDQLSQVKIPTLVVAGREDPVVPFAHQRTMAAVMPRGRLSQFADVGHIPMIERPIPFCSTVDSSFQY